MRIRIIGIFLLLSLIPGMAGCKRNPYRVNISAVSVGVEITRLEKDIFEPDPLAIPAAINDLRKKYGTFLQLFSYVINTGIVSDTSFSSSLVHFCTDKLNNEVYQSVMQLYPDVTAIENDLDKAFRHYKYYFPEKSVPLLYTCITGFNNSMIIGDSVIGIGLDRYLGQESEYYKRLQIYRYLAMRMNPGNIVPDCIYAWGTSEWDLALMGYGKDDVMTEMIHEGKLRYFQRCMMPDLSDTVLFGYTADQMKFCRNNEMQMWHYLVEHDLLFSSDQFTIRKLVGEAPFTTFFTNESPGRASAWLGFRIIESYMMKNRNVSLEEMMKNTDIQGILTASRYDPK
ncbi:MAG: hypothetical protein V1903_06900 [Bacteroidota bacterium]